MSDNPTERRSTHTIRFSNSEWTTVRDQAERAGLRPTVYVRRSALGKTVQARPEPTQRATATALVDQDRQLARIGNNLNQLVRLAHIGKVRHDRDFLDVLNGLRRDVDGSRREIRTAVRALVGARDEAEA